MNLTYKGGGYRVQKVLDITITVPLREGANLKNTYLLPAIYFFYICLVKKINISNLYLQYKCLLINYILIHVDKNILFYPWRPFVFREVKTVYWIGTRSVEVKCVNSGRILGLEIVSGWRLEDVEYGGRGFSEVRV